MPTKTRGEILTVVPFLARMVVVRRTSLTRGADVLTNSGTVRSEVVLDETGQLDVWTTGLTTIGDAVPSWLR